MPAMPDIGSMQYVIFKCEDGGYIVRTMPHLHDGGFYPPVFASTRIADALEYIRDKMEPAK